ncbi:hypothetical protein BDV18DRAFT_30877 [Aspergillus unguis]
MGLHGVSLHITAQVSPEDVPKFLAAFVSVYDQVIAEPECTFFEVYQSPDDPGTISWVENWSESQEWLLENQVEKPYYNGYREITSSLLLRPMDIKIWDRFGPEFSMFKRENGGLRE